MFFHHANPIVRKVFFIFLLVVLLMGGWWLGQRNTEAINFHAVPDHSIIDWQLEGESLQVEIVNTPKSIEDGLGGQEGLETDGMLFVFNRPTTPIFWMKGMLFPIDIVWISDGKIVGIESNAQPPEAGETTDQLERFSAPQSVDMVLETAPGRLEQ